MSQSVFPGPNPLALLPQKKHPVFPEGHRQGRWPAASRDFSADSACMRMLNRIERKMNGEAEFGVADGRGAFPHVSGPGLKLSGRRGRPSEAGTDSGMGRSTIAGALLRLGHATLC